MALLGKIRSLGPVALISVIGLALFAFVFSTGTGTVTDVFKADEFKPTPKRHSLKIGKNYFSRDEISLDLPNIKGDLKFRNLSPWSNSFLSPGIMGPYSFIPFMECYHGIVSMDHDILGSLKYNNEDISFKKGKGYMEKDWGHSFPKAYIWMQSNHFSKPDISLKSWAQPQTRGGTNASGKLGKVNVTRTHR